MFLELAYKEIKIVSLSKAFVHQCYQIAKDIPAEEVHNLIQQFKQAALAAHLSISEGAFIKSRRKQRDYFKSAQRSLIVADAAFGVLYELEYVKSDAIPEFSKSLIATYGLLKKLIAK